MDDSPISIVNLPSEVLKEIFKELEFREVFKLRRVCHRFKGYVDDAKPGSKIKYFVFTAITNGISCQFGLNLEELKTKNYGQTILSLYGDDNYLKAILKLFDHQKSKLKVLSIRNRLENDDNGYEKLLESLNKLLSSMSYMLEVSKLEIYGTKESEFMKILPFFRFELFKVLVPDNIRNPHENNAKPVLDISDVQLLDQWGNMQRLSSFPLIFTSRIQKFVHLKLSKFHLETVSVEEILKLRDAVIESPKKEFTVYYTTMEGNVRDFYADSVIHYCEPLQEVQFEYRNPETKKSVIVTHSPNLRMFIVLARPEGSLKTRRRMVQRERPDPRH